MVLTIGAMATIELLDFIQFEQNYKAFVKAVTLQKTPIYRDIYALKMAKKLALLAAFPVASVSKPN